MKESKVMAKPSRTSDIYVDANGNKVVEPVYNGNGCVSGMIGVRK